MDQLNQFTPQCLGLLDAFGTGALAQRSDQAFGGGYAGVCAKKGVFQRLVPRVIDACGPKQPGNGLP